MAQMERNVNLEEIDSDAPFGIDALKNQTIAQKVVFTTCLLGGVLINVALPLLFHTPRIFCIALFLILLCIGIAFGCNYEDEMSYGKYLYRSVFQPVKTLTFCSTEDIREVDKKAEALRQKEEMILRQEAGRDPKEQRKMLLKLILFGVLIVTILGGTLIYKSVTKESSLHHEVTEKEN